MKTVINNIREVKNLEEAKKLVEKYRSITLEDLEANKSDKSEPAWMALNRITGFGKQQTCSLCAPLGGIDCTCTKCIYYSEKCNSFEFPCTVDETYEAIDFAKNTVDLLQAIKDRADYIETLIEKYEDD